MTQDMDTMFNDLRQDWTTRTASDEELEEKVQSGVRPIPKALFSDTTADASSSEPAPSENVPDLGYPYELIEKIGKGAMGDIWRAHDMKLMRDVAIKVAQSSDGSRSPFHEARLAARAEHPNVVRVYDVGLTSEGAPFLVMELLNGEDLASVLARQGRTSCKAAVDIGLSLLSGLEAVHAARVVHRDIKPSNVFLSKVGGQTVVKLLDFGVAVRPQPGSTERFAGTPMYMAPEQLVAGAPASIRTDIFGVAAILFQMVTGKQLSRMNWTQASTFEIAKSRDLSPLRDYCDEGLREILERALAPEAKNRFPSARAFQEALLDWSASYAPPQSTRAAG